jgi:hypothetical protein
MSEFMAMASLSYGALSRAACDSSIESDTTPPFLLPFPLSGEEAKSGPKRRLHRRVSFQCIRSLLNMPRKEVIHE